MKTWIVIFYRQYGNWSSTAPFESRDAAERHADRYLRSDAIKDANGRVLVDNTRRHIEDITFKDVELPE